jgi:hypothetical protein
MAPPNRRFSRRRRRRAPDHPRPSPARQLADPPPPGPPATPSPEEGRPARPGARVRLGSPHALAEAARGEAPGTGDGTRVTTCTGPWPDPYRHAPRVTPAAHCPPARPPPRRRTSQPDPTGPVCLSYTLRPSLGGCHPCNRSVPRTQLEYGSLTMGLVWRWPVHDILPILSGPVFMRKTRRGRDLEILGRRSGPSTGELPRGPTNPAQLQNGHTVVRT